MASINLHRKFEFTRADWAYVVVGPLVFGVVVGVVTRSLFMVFVAAVAAVPGALLAGCFNSNLRARTKRPA